MYAISLVTAAIPVSHSIKQTVRDIASQIREMCQRACMVNAFMMSHV